MSEETCPENLSQTGELLKQAPPKTTSPEKISPEKISQIQQIIRESSLSEAEKNRLTEDLQNLEALQRLPQVVKALEESLQGWPQATAALEALKKSLQMWPQATKALEEALREKILSEIIQQIIAESVAKSPLSEDKRARLIEALQSWRKNLIHPGILNYVISHDPEEYFNSDNSLYKTWGAAGWLYREVEKAVAEGRDLSEEEIKKATKNFQAAGEARKRYNKSEGENLLIIAEHPEVLAEIYKGLLSFPPHSPVPEATSSQK